MSLVGRRDSVDLRPKVNEGEKLSRIGIIDIGSNSVRMVVFSSQTRLPIPIFNEKVTCGLGRNIGKTNQLNPEGRDLALQSLERFCGMAKEMQIDTLKIIATSAVREAKDGKQFAQKIERSFGHKVNILTGGVEAELCAKGLLGANPEADGLLGDMGGGSLELVSLNEGKTGKTATLPLGHLRISEFVEETGGDANTIIDEHLKKIVWLSNLEKKDFYLVGGIWRSIARIYIQQKDYPIKIIDNLIINKQDAIAITEVISKLSRNSLKKITSVGRRRIDTLPIATLVLRRIIDKISPKRLIFSSYGIREGKFFEMAPPELIDQDPLINACEYYGFQAGRFAVSRDEVFSWVKVIFENIGPREKRLVEAACLLGDIGWPEHPDYRAMHSFARVLRLPIAGITHRERVLLALSIYHRYDGNEYGPEMTTAIKLIDQKDRDLAFILGLVLKLAHKLSGGVPGLLIQTKLLKTEDGYLVDFSNKEYLFNTKYVNNLVSKINTHIRSLDFY